jgi:hypothetical protein
VAPSGTSSNPGTKDRPLSLQKAVSTTSPARPGDTVWIRGGTYPGGIESYISGAAGKPIIFRQYPGERAIISHTHTNQHVLYIGGPHTWFWGLEIANPSTGNRTCPVNGGMVRGTGVRIDGPNTKCINLVVHDVGHGIVPSRYAPDSEIYGCLVFNGGWEDPGRTDGHAIYGASKGGTLRLVDNILFNNYGYGLHFYAEGAPNELKGLHCEGNASFNNGILSAGRVLLPNYLVGGKPSSADRITFLNNNGYHSPGYVRQENTMVVDMGYAWGKVNNGTCTFQGNYIAGAVSKFSGWTNLIATDNTFALLGNSIQFTPSTTGAKKYTVDRNSYYMTGATPFYLSGVKQTFASWKTATGYDAKSALTAGRPSGAQIFVRKNAYENNRAHIVVFNWALNSSVPVDVSGVLQLGAAYELRSVQNFFGSPVLRGTYDGRPLSVPMNNLPVAKPAGVATPPATGPEFNAFVLVPAAGAAGDIAPVPPTNLRLHSLLRTD